MMGVNEIELERLAEQYTVMYGENAYALIGDEISSAIGMRQWDMAYALQQVQWRVRKLERLRQITAQMRSNRNSPDMAGPSH